MPKLKKMIKVSMNTRSTIKQNLPLFTSKFDTDFSSFKIIAKAKCKTGKVEVRTDVPIRYWMACLPQQLMENEVMVVEIGVSYEGG